MPDISVIVPVYNGERFIEEALTSVLDQTYRDFEVIVVNDGSTDRTGKILEVYERKGLIRCFVRDNGGSAGARNTGLNAARGRYIAFLDADDEWCPEKLERQRLFFSRHPSIKAVHTELEIVKNGRLLPNAFNRQGLIREGWLFEHILLLKSWVFLSTLMVERALQSVGYFNESLRTAEDTNLILRLSKRYRFGFMDDILLRRRVHDANLSHSGTGNYGTFKNLEDIAKRYPELDPSRSVLMRRAYELRYLMFGYSAFRSSRYAAARSFLLKAIRLRPVNVRAITYLGASFFPEAMLKGIRQVKARVMNLVKPGSFDDREKA